MSEELDSLVADVMRDEVEWDVEPGNFEECYERFSGEVERHLISMGENGLYELQSDAERRFSTALPLDKVHGTVIAMVGCGGLGNHIWKVLVGMGFTHLHIFDPDTVDAVNIGPQMHKVIDLGLPKVEAARREALAFRGIEIYAHQKKVDSFGDIVSAVGRVPDVLIGATDSAEFRNAIIRSFENDIRLKLFLDIRMSLGDWNCFAFTPAALVAADGSRRLYVRKLSTYSNLAVFDSSAAVQEPCTARAITYTGANVASYVGAFMHWWIAEGEEKCADYDFLEKSFYSDDRNGTNFNWMYRCSSKEFMPETKTVAQAEAVADAARTCVLKAAIGSLMDRQWDSVDSAGLGDGERGATNGRHTEAYLDYDGVTHVYQANFAKLLRYPWMLKKDGNHVPLENACIAFAVDLNLSTGRARVAVKPFMSRMRFPEIELQLSKKLSARRVHTVWLEKTGPLSVLVRASREPEPALVDFAVGLLTSDQSEDGPIARALRELWTGNDAARRSEPFCNAVHLGERFGDNDVKAVVLGLKSIDTDCAEYVAKAFVFEGGDWDRRREVPVWKLREELHCDAGRVFGCTGWKRFSMNGSGALSFIPIDVLEDGDESRRNEAREDQRLAESVRMALGEAEMCDGVASLADVEDGARVSMIPFNGTTYVKRTENGLTCLYDGIRNIYVDSRTTVLVRREG